MIPLTLVIALQWLPMEPITVNPVEPTPVEIVDLGPSVEEMERALQRQEAIGECSE
jgi:hypothetical protein